MAMELRGSPTDENYFSGSTFVPDFLLVGKLISEKGRPLKMIWRKILGSFQIESIHPEQHDPIVPDLERSFILFSLHRINAKLQEYPPPPPPIQASYNLERVFLFIRNAIWNHLERSGTIWIRAWSHRVRNRSWIRGNIRAPLHTRVVVDNRCPPIWNRHRNLERSGTIWNASRR